MFSGFQHYVPSISRPRAGSLLTRLATVRFRSRGWGAPSRPAEAEVVRASRRHSRRGLIAFPEKSDEDTLIIEPTYHSIIEGVILFAPLAANHLMILSCECTVYGLPVTC